MATIAGACQNRVEFLHILQRTTVLLMIWSSGETRDEDQRSLHRPPDYDNAEYAGNHHLRFNVVYVAARKRSPEHRLLDDPTSWWSAASEPGEDGVHGCHADGTPVNYDRGTWR